MSVEEPFTTESVICLRLKLMEVVSDTGNGMFIQRLEDETEGLKD